MSVPAHTAGQRYPGARAGSRRDARALARGHRDAVRRRTRRIRRSVAGLAVTLFALAFLVVYVQLASGHDPALVANAEKRAATSSSVTHKSSSSGTSTAARESSSESSGASESSATSTGTTEASGSSASAVTTSQS